MAYFGVTAFWRCAEVQQVPWFVRNVALAGRRPLSAWRNLALSAWSSVGEASVHAVIEVDVEPLLRFLARESERTCRPITLVHAVGKAVGNALRTLPEINCLMRWGRLDQRRDVDLFFPVALDPEGRDLSALVVREVDRLSLEELAQRLSEQVHSLRHEGEAEFKELKSQLFGRFLMRAAGFFLYTLNLWTPALGFPRDAFGSAAITDLSRFGAELAFPPILPIARLPLVVGIAPLAERFDATGQRRQLLRLCVVFDHRVIDGV